MKDILDRSFMLSAKAANTKVGEEVVILHLEEGVYFSLDQVAAKLWDGIAADTPLRVLCAEIANKYGVEPTRVEEDIRAFINELLALDLIYQTGAQQDQTQ